MNRWGQTALPSEKTCLYTGFFNRSIVIPEVVAAIGLGWFMGAFLECDRLAAVILGGGFMAVGAVLSPFYSDDIYSDDKP